MDDEGQDIRLEVDVTPEWSWSGALAGIPQIRAVAIQASRPYEHASSVDSAERSCCSCGHDANGLNSKAD